MGLLLPLCSIVFLKKKCRMLKIVCTLSDFEAKGKEDVNTRIEEEEEQEEEEEEKEEGEEDEDEEEEKDDYDDDDGDHEQLKSARALGMWL
jgi:ABC-type Zn2+ transport system substrate-binding protein/surface adhesin